MKSILKTLSLVLLLLNGSGAVLGGWNLIAHPDGSGMHMSLDYLQHSPFHNYFIPGIILFIANGLFSFLVIAALLFRHKYASWFIVAQGAILTGWIIIQVLIVQILNNLHIIFSSMGLLLMLCGWLLIRKDVQDVKNMVNLNL